MIIRARILIVVVTISILMFHAEGAAAEEQEPIYHVSMIKVLADPEVFVGKRISVAGYVAHEELPMLYLSEEHALIYNDVSGVHVSQSAVLDSSCLGRFVIVSGRIWKDASGAYFLKEIFSMKYGRPEDGHLVSCRNKQK